MSILKILFQEIPFHPELRELFIEHGQESARPIYRNHRALPVERAARRFACDDRRPACRFHHSWVFRNKIRHRLKLGQLGGRSGFWWMVW